jgi:sulfur carrier protein
MPRETPSPVLSVTVNGEPLEAPGGATVRVLLERLGLDGRRIAVAVERDVVPRSEYARRRLCDGDRVEILEAVGGG